MDKDTADAIEIMEKQRVEMDQKIADQGAAIVALAASIADLVASLTKALQNITAKQG